ncbi:cystatin domain-containing protein [Algoriphagus taiwanensis]|uniref:Cystatin domain-containing protein n=1 Tax=Algoriphagus taiwanensis TaxID=1445656 RepID=A0ABQ6PZN4_9BACT|nr:cystatin domain-containing protein [Algoriphagus taiwanensis]
MKNSILILLGLSLTFSCKSPSESSEEALSMPEESSSQPEEIMAGGWEEIPVDQEVEEAAKFASENIDPEFYLQKILSAKRQVVKGYNYDVTFTLENGETWNAIVYRDLDGKYSLTQHTLLPKEE